MSIIESLLDTDFYKFTMQQAVLHQFPGTQVEYAFKCRTPDIVWHDDVVRGINKEIDHLCTLRFSQEELDYLANIRWIKRDYIDFLSLFQFNRKHIVAFRSPETRELVIRIKGSWLLTILFEVPILAIVNEVYYRHTYPDLYGIPAMYKAGRPVLQEKIKLLPDDIRITDFGTRRRFCGDWQREAVMWMIHNTSRNCFVGTSNVALARRYKITPIGTMAHEWIQAGQGVGVRLVDSQKRMLQAWVDEYRGQLGTALTDTLGVKAFIKDFDLYFAKLYDGVRHDSGDPIMWGEAILDMYHWLGIDPKTKTLIFSDSLTFPKAIEIHNYFKDRTKVSFGIGTNLTNDFPGVTPLNVVIKMVKCNDHPVAKISDSPGKGMCEEEGYVVYLKSIFNIK